MSQAVGQPIWSLDTPVLLVDLDRLEANIRRMARTIVHEAGVRWRPHTKAMKSPVLARMLLAAGATGITCAKLAEAEVMAAAGLDDILIANQVVGAVKLQRLARLSAKAQVIVAIDCDAHVEAMAAAADQHGATYRLVIELDVGMHRAGLEPGPKVIDLARRVAACPRLKFAGLMTWESHALKLPDADARQRCVAEALGRVNEMAGQLRAAGLPVPIVSCGGTGTYWISPFEPGVTEIQAGGGIFCDVHYRDGLGVKHECAMTVLSTVTSRPTSTRIICDAGRKTMSADAAVPEPIGLGRIASAGFSAEHGTIELVEPGHRPQVGDKIEFIVGYSDTTVVLHDELTATRNGVVQAVWPLVGRGRLT